MRWARLRGAHRPLAEVGPGVSRAMQVLYLGTTAFVAMRVFEILHRDLQVAQSAELLWPVVWMRLVPWSRELLLFGVSAASLAAVVFWRRQPIRVGLAATYAMQAAFVSSFGKVNHNDHMLVWTLVLFGTPSSATLMHSSRRAYWTRATMFWRAQFLIAFFYFLAGFWKVLAGLIQWRLGEPHLFSVEAMPRHLAARLLQTRSESRLADWMIDHPLISTVSLWTGVLIEVGAIVLPFVPRFHRLGGVALIGLHLGIGLAMTIWFDANFLVLAVLFLFSPLAPGHSRSAKVSAAE